MKECPCKTCKFGDAADPNTRYKCESESDKDDCSRYWEWKFETESEHIDS